MSKQNQIKDFPQNSRKVKRVVIMGLLYFAQDAQVAHWMCQCAIYAQDSVPMRNICAKFAQDCTYCLFPQCAIYAQDLGKIVLLISPMCNICARLYLFPQCAIYAQDLRKIVLLSPMRSICTRFAQDCTSLPNVQRLQALLEEICHISHICSKFRMVFTS